MGREYGGDIEGKFWFGVQGSDDIGNLVNIEPLPQSLTWHGCGCTVDFDEKNDLYCKNCYESKEAFLDEMGEDFDEDPYFEEQVIVYQLYEEHLDELKETMENLEKEIDPRIIAEFKKIDKDMSNAFEGIFKPVSEVINQVLKEKEETKNNTEIIARYTLGQQIKQCLEKKGSCTICCEL